MWVAPLVVLLLMPSQATDGVPLSGAPNASAPDMAAPVAGPTTPIPAGPGATAPAATTPTATAPAATAPAATTPAQPPAGPNFIGQPITTRQTAFSIPFQVPHAKDPGQSPTEVQLYVSGDLGRTWQFSGRARPDQRAFAFRSPRDGQYWFAIRTIDSSGRAQSDAAVSILRVIVDTMPPQLALQAVRGSDGQVTAQWRAADPTLKAESVLIQYRTGSEQNWQRVAIGKQSYDPATGTQTGEATWWPNVNKGVVQVRAEALDAAGNPAVSHAQVDLNTKPAATEVAKAAPDAAKTQQANRYQTVSGAPPIAEQTEPSSAAKTPATNASTPSTPAPSNTPAPNTSAAKGASGSTPVNGAPMRPLLVRSLRFELDYDLATAPQGLQRVELWGTADAGNSWSLFAVDEDQRAPIRVAVPQPGLYGFRLVLRNAAGQGDLFPQRGDRPETWVSVEPSAPLGRIRDVRSVP